MLSTEQLNNINLCKQYVERLKSTDSISEREKLKRAIEDLNLKELTNIIVRTQHGRIGRAKYSHNGVFKVFFNNSRDYLWSNNQTYAYIWELELLDEKEYMPDVDKISDLKNEIEELSEQIEQEQDKCIHDVDPYGFKDTKEIKRNVISFSDEPTYVQEAFCRICGARITS